MGNYRFKLSDMIPNVWFYKLKDIGRSRKQNQTQSKKKKQPSPASTTQPPSKPKQPHQYNPRKSYYFTRELNSNDRILTSQTNNQNAKDSTNFLEPPRKSSKQRLNRRTPRTTSPKLVVNVITNNNNDNNNNNLSSPHDTIPAESESPDPEIRTDRVLRTESFNETVPCSNCCSCSLHSNTNTKDIIIDVDNNSIARKDDKLERYEYDSFSDLVLPPIVTKPEKFDELHSEDKKKETKPRSKMVSHEEQNLQGSLRVKIVKEHKNISSRRFSMSSPGVRRLRMNSPRIASRRIQAHGRRNVSSGRRSLSDSFAIVKSSLNPQRDFTESMVEMIVQNNIRSSKDLEDLLACYLSLNSDEYHDLIIKVFKQIWFDLTDN